MVFRVDVIDVRRDQADRAIIQDMEIRRQPLEMLRFEDSCDIGRAGLEGLSRDAIYRAPVDDGVERRMHEIEHFAVGPWVPVSL